MKPHLKLALITGGLLLVQLVFFWQFSRNLKGDSTRSIQGHQIVAEKKVNKMLCRFKRDLNTFDLDLSKQEIPCKPYTKVAFARTHRTGSSTLQNILFRFGSTNGLVFALPSDPASFKVPFTSDAVLGLPSSQLSYEILSYPSLVWNHKEVQKILPTALYITIIRDPVDNFISEYVSSGNKNIEDLAPKVEQSSNVRSHEYTGMNLQLRNFGLSVEALDTTELVLDKIKELDEQFHFVLLAEYFDECLVMLAKILCWELKDVRYLKHNVMKPFLRPQLNQTTKDQLKKGLVADYMLYDHFLTKFELAANRYGRRELGQDVGLLRTLNRNLEDNCVIGVVDNSLLKGVYRGGDASGIGYMLDPKKQWCGPFAFPETSFYSIIHAVQINRFSKIKKD